MTLASRVLSAIRRNGGVVTFPGTATGQVYDPATDTFSGGAAGGDVTGRAVQAKDEPARFAALGLTMQDAITLLIAAEGLGVTPAPGMAVQWAGTTYTLKSVEPVAPSGTPVYFTVVGVR